jgi:hypothetical protein
MIYLLKGLALLALATFIIVRFEEEILGLMALGTIVTLCYLLGRCV